MTTLVWLVIALPLAGAAILLLAGRRTDSWGHLLGCLAALASFAAGVVLFVDMVGRHAEDRIVHESICSRGCRSRVCMSTSACSWMRCRCVSCY